MAAASPGAIRAGIGWLLVIGFCLQLLGCATHLPEHMEAAPTYAVAADPESRLGRWVEAAITSADGSAGLFTMGHADDGFTARMQLVELADHSIDAQYYLVDDDVSGRLFLGRLLAAADRGVRVRLLMDDIDLEGHDALLAGLDAHPHFDLRVFNPFSREGSRGGQFLSRFEEVSHRMHNKSFTVDNLVTIVGGRNIGDQYFSADPKLGFLDLDLMAIGSPVAAVSAQFDLYWNSSLAYPATVLLPGVSADARQGALTALREAALRAAQTPFAMASGKSELARRIQDGNIRFRWGTAEVAYDAPGKLTPQEEDDAFLLADKAW